MLFDTKLCFVAHTDFCHSVAQAALRFVSIILPWPPVLGLLVCTTMPNLSFNNCAKMAPAVIPYHKVAFLLSIIEWSAERFFETNCLLPVRL